MTDSLFCLIKSMNTAEKIHFKRSMKKQADGKNPSYLILFDCMEQLESFDENMLQKKLNAKKFAANYSKTKSYLFEILLNFIEEYNTDNSETRITSRLVRRVQVLYEKGIYDEAEVLLSKAKERAIYYQHFESLVLIYEHELGLIWKNNTNYRFKLIEEKHEEKEKAIQSLYKNNQYAKVLNLIHVLYSESPSTKDEAVLRMAIDLIEKLKSLGEPSSFYQFLSMYLTYAIYYNLIGDYSMMCESYDKVLQLYEVNAQMKKRYKSYYSNSLKNFLAAAHYQRRYIGYQARLDDLKISIEHLEGHYKSFPELFFQFLKQDIAITRGEIELALQMIKISKPAKLKLAANVFDETVQLKINYQCAYALLLKGDFLEANKHINAVLNLFDIKEKARIDLYFSAKMLKLLITYELGEYELLHDLSQSTQRYFVRHNKLFEIERLFLGFFKKLLVDPSPINLWMELKADLASLNKSGLFEVFGFDVMAWIESKIQKRSAIAIITENAKLHYPEIFAIQV